MDGPWLPCLKHTWYISKKIYAQNTVTATLSVLIYILEPGGVEGACCQPTKIPLLLQATGRGWAPNSILVLRYLYIILG
jgi:hypothetical protein